MKASGSIAKSFREGRTLNHLSWEFEQGGTTPHPAPHKETPELFKDLPKEIYTRQRGQGWFPIEKQQSLFGTPASSPMLRTER